ncbi:MAG: DUF4013 domain-containing protein [Candidatus Aenigmarchaeota archaeon]|nr:DUF4013 domain-containing protein [Candidatus Aenigmarchaeota archaeon]
MVDYEKAIKRPFQDVKKLLIGSILNIIPIVNLITSGYIINSAKNTMNKKNDLPEWENWGDLFITGLVAAVISFIYFIPAGAVLLVGVGSLISGVIAGEITAANMSSIIASGGIMIIVGILLSIATMLIVPMAIMRYVDKGEFSAAFAIGDVLKKVLSGKYVVAWIVMIVYAVILGSVSFVIPVAGAAIAAYIVGLTTMTVFAEVYSEV